MIERKQRKKKTNFSEKLVTENTGQKLHFPTAREKLLDRGRIGATEARTPDKPC